MEHLQTNSDLGPTAFLLLLPLGAFFVRRLTHYRAWGQCMWGQNSTEIAALLIVSGARFSGIALTSPFVLALFPSSGACCVFAWGTSKSLIVAYIVSPSPTSLLPHLSRFFSNSFGSSHQPFPVH